MTEVIFVVGMVFHKEISIAQTEIRQKKKPEQKIYWSRLEKIEQYHKGNRSC